MGYKEKDEELRQTVYTALVDRLNINANKEVGVMHLQPMPEDRLNPSVVLSRDEIREFTGRSKVRDVVLDDFAGKLQAPNFLVQKLDEDRLKVTFVPEKEVENQFRSLKDLQAKNNKELATDPDLGNPVY